MRWDSMRLDADSSDAGATLPLIERNAVARTFDTPEFRGMTFYEVQAKSIVSHVPAASKLPLGWTINPYRGCSHSCVYCLGAETPVLMADGTTRPIANLRLGDAIYGTVRQGSHRRYVITEVLAHWSTVKPGYRITLEDGTTLIASGDHRFLTGRGWKHVTGAEQGPDQRPFLTTNNKLMGFGGFTEPPKKSMDYQRGYLCAMIRGDAHLGAGRYTPARDEARYYFRLALTDSQALNRARDYVAHFAVFTTEFDFSLQTATRRPLQAIRTGRRSAVETIEGLTDWPVYPEREWMCGFLAGIFDAEGTYSTGVWRVSSINPEIIQWTTRALSFFGFSYVIEDPHKPKDLRVVRLSGGLREVMRFFHTTDPAITRKRSIEGRAIKSEANLKVASVEPLGLELPMYDITTGTGDFIANGVVSHNCFARNSHTYLDLDSGHDFNTKIVVKVNAPQLLEAKLASPRWAGEHIAMGTNVDCYQRAEGRYELMRGIIGALRDAANPFSILTKGTLILRDLDLLQSAAEVTDVGLNVSAAFLDRDLWRAIEPGTPAPERRLAAAATLNDAGLRCGVLMGPIVPYLSDSPEQLAAAVRAAAEAGAHHVMPIVLHLRPGAREWFLRWLGEAHPALVPRYAELYGQGPYARQAYQSRITAQVRELAERLGVGQRGTPPAPRGIRGPRPAPAPRRPPSANAPLTRR